MKKKEKRGPSLGGRPPIYIFLLAEGSSNEKVGDELGIKDTPKQNSRVQPWIPGNIGVRRRNYEAEARCDIWTNTEGGM